MTCKVIAQIFSLAIVTLFQLHLSAQQAQDAVPSGYDPERLPNGREYYELRDGLANCYRKFASEKKGRIAFLGGSITAGSGWRNKTMQYLEQIFPETKFDFIGAGISSLGSVPHAFRLQRDVLDHGQVDLLIVEAAVNDTSNTNEPSHMLRGMEGVVRHARISNPMIDIVHLHFVMPQHMTDYQAGRTPISIAQHEKVAAAYGNVTLNLSLEVTERIAAKQFRWKEDFRNLHPSPFGHQLYANSIGRMFDAAFQPRSMPKPTPHSLPPPVDPHSYFRGRLGDISRATQLNGFRQVESWQPGDKVGTRAGFVNVPALIGSGEGSSFKFSFHGTGVGLFLTSGPDAARLEFSIDGGDFQSVETYTQWSSRLHLPWVVMLSDSLTNEPHTVTIRIARPNDGKASRVAARIQHLLLN